MASSEHDKQGTGVLGWLAGCEPMLALELRAHSRRRRTYTIRVAFLGGLAMFVAVFWWTRGGDLGATSTYAMARMADVGQTLALWTLGFLFVGSQLAALVLTSTAFADEQRRGMFLVLRSTPLSYSQIVVGKYVSRMAQVLVLTLAALPVLAVERMLGGVTWTVTAFGVFTVPAAAAFAGAVGLYLSPRCRGPVECIVRGVLVCGVLEAVCVGLAPMGIPYELIPILSGVAMLLAAAATLIGSIGGFAKRVEFALQGQLAPGRARSIPSPSTPETPAEQEAEIDQALAAMAADHEAMHEWDAMRPKRETPAKWVEWVEWRGGHKAVRLAGWSVAVGLLAAGYYAMAAVRSATVSATMYSLATLLALSYVFTCAARSIAWDRQVGRWGLLLTTPLAMPDILVGKLRPVVRAYLHFTLTAAVCVLLGSTMRAAVPLAAVQLALVQVYAGLFVLGLGVWVSAGSRSFTGALLTAAAVLVFLWAIVPALHPAASWLSPFMQIWHVIDGSMRLASYRYDGLWYAFEGTRMSGWEFLGFLLLTAVLHAGAGVLLLWRATRRMGYA